MHGEFESVVFLGFITSAVIFRARDKKQPILAGMAANLAVIPLAEAVN
jgi:hypothetical protein